MNNAETPSSAPPPQDPERGIPVPPVNTRTLERNLLGAWRGSIRPLGGSAESERKDATTQGSDTPTEGSPNIGKKSAGVLENVERLRAGTVGGEEEPPVSKELVKMRELFRRAYTDIFKSAGATNTEINEELGEYPKRMAARQALADARSLCHRYNTMMFTLLHRAHATEPEVEGRANYQKGGTVVSTVGKHRKLPDLPHDTDKHPTLRGVKEYMQFLAKYSLIVPITSACARKGEYPSLNTVKEFALVFSTQPKTEDPYMHLDYRLMSSITGACHGVGLPTADNTKAFLKIFCPEGEKDPIAYLSSERGESARGVLSSITGACNGVGLPTADTTQAFLKIFCPEGEKDPIAYLTEERGKAARQFLSSVTGKMNGQGLNTKTAETLFQ